MEEAIRGDFAFVKAWKGDTAGTNRMHHFRCNWVALDVLYWRVRCVLARLLTGRQETWFSKELLGISIPWSPQPAKLRWLKWSTLCPQVCIATKSTIIAKHLLILLLPTLLTINSILLLPSNKMCTGSLDPDEIHVPGIYVSRIYQPPSFEKRIERLTLQKEPGAAEGKGLGVRERIVKRAAKELKDGMCDTIIENTHSRTRCF